MKRVIAIHDISSVGKCSLTAAIPLISALGIECNPLPTAILSTHTGEISGYTFTSLTENMLPSFNHWMSLGLKFDGIYSGYLGSIDQIAAVEEIISRTPEALVTVDPAMADSGKLYVGFDNRFASEMKKLCRKADIIVPNLTEACLLTDSEYKPVFSKKEYIEILKKLGSISKRFVVLTGAAFSDNESGTAVYDSRTDKYVFYSGVKYPGVYYGTGDIFASVLVASVLRGKDCFYAAKAAMDFTALAIKDTYEQKTDTRFGVAFEPHIPDLIKILEDQYELC